MAIESVSPENFIVEIEDAVTGGDTIRITCSLTGATYTRGFDINETATLCSTAKAPGPANNQLTFDGLLDGGSDPNSINQLVAVSSGKLRVPFRVGPIGDAGGALMFSGYGYLTGLEFGVTAGGQVTASGTFPVDGDDVATTWPA